MKTNRSWVSGILGLLFLASMYVPLSVLADDGASSRPTTFLVKEGAFPWSDRVNVWQLIGVPASLTGNGPISQQNCSSHSLVVPDGTKSVIFAVAASDADKLKSDFPAAQLTGETISVAHPDGTNIIPYTIFKLASPPATVGDPAFGAGVILLQIGDKTTASSPSTNAPPAAAQ